MLMNYVADRFISNGMTQTNILGDSFLTRQPNSNCACLLFQFSFLLSAIKKGTEVPFYTV